MLFRISMITILFMCVFIPDAPTYPIDGYPYTNIRRLEYLQRVLDGKIKGTMPIDGAMRKTYEIQLNLDNERGDSLETIPAPDPELQAAINSLFPRLNENYSIALLDITEGRPIRYASRKETAGYQPGSVGKLAVLLGFFTELAKIYPDSFAQRLDLLCTKEVRGGTWALYDEHSISIFNPQTENLLKRTVQANDVFRLYEWLDFMLSVSNNGAAAVCWREAILMRVFGNKYPTLTEKQAEEYFRTTRKDTLSDIAISVVNDPLRAIGISKDEWRLGTIFTSGGGDYIPPKGGSTGTPLGLMKYLIRLERGKLVDEATSLEMKKLLYMTDRRIRYAASPALKGAAVYFKSGSLYKCAPEAGYVCAKYKGNVDNYMNSVAIIEHSDCTTYMVALMSNVRRKNSASDHMALAASIDKIVRK
ncbi:MAG TPA: serine hydrolase [Saprospiraceae bacterium]|nr:serine hydrolase [Saprospiraceae bacterium]